MGNIAWGCSMVLKERLTIVNNAIKERNFGAYNILRYDEMPEINIDLVSDPNEKPLGVGESAIGPVAPAITNAIYSAIGYRARSLPIDFKEIAL
jgi:isoquinoline 1-oxidoreductase beta subunit